MAFLSFDRSACKGKPIELYRFIVNEGASYYHYTSAAEDFEYLGVTYEAMPGINRSGYEISDSTIRSDMDITLPVSAGIVADHYIALQPEYTIRINVFRMHTNDAELEWKCVWCGHINKCSISGSKATLKCLTNLTMLRRMPERRFVQTLCPYRIYSKFCGVQQDEYRLRVTNAVINSLSELQHDNFAVEGGDGWFAAGWLELDSGEIRTIVKHVGNAVTLKVPLPEQDKTTVAVTLFAGCDHLVETCQGKFNNLPNFGGFPDIPTDNPYTGSSLGI